MEEYVIGFGGEFYTLWHEQEVQGSEEMDQTFLQNLSKDLNEAKKKASELVNAPVRIDLDLKGQTWDIQEKEVFEVGQYTFGQKKGEMIKDTLIEDKFFLNRVVFNEPLEENKIIAKKRLAELGIMEEYKGEFHYPKMIEVLKKKELEKTFIYGHHYNAGEKVELTIRKTAEFAYDGTYGTCYIETYIDTDNRVFKYMGGSPPSIEVNETVKIKGTCKLAEYKDIKETRLQRIKIVA